MVKSFVRRGIGQASGYDQGQSFLRRVKSPFAYLGFPSQPHFLRLACSMYQIQGCHILPQVVHSKVQQASQNSDSTSQTSPMAGALVSMARGTAEQFSAALPIMLDFFNRFDTKFPVQSETSSKTAFPKSQLSLKPSTQTASGINSSARLGLRESIMQFQIWMRLTSP